MRKCTFIILLLLLQIYGCALTDKSSYHHEHFLLKEYSNKSISKITERGNFKTELYFNSTVLRVGDHSFDIRLSDKKEYIDGATITVIPWNIEYLHGSLTTPTITNKGKGLYTVNKLNLNRSGHWKIVIEIDNEGIKDKVEFIFHVYK